MSLNYRQSLVCRVSARGGCKEGVHVSLDMVLANEEPFAAAMSFAEQKYESAARARAALDRDFTCSICLETMDNAFLTRCGHSFCHSCITTHLDNRNNCPSCGQYLTIDLIVPNVLLTKVISYPNIVEFYSELRIR